MIVITFLTAVIQYFTCSLASMKVPDEGAIDMRAYEARNGIGYKLAYVALSVIVIVLNALQFEVLAGQRFNWALFIDASWTIVAFATAILASIWWRARWFEIAVPVAYSVFLVGMWLIPA